MIPFNKKETKKEKTGFFIRALASFFCISILNQLFFPTLVLALNSGPSQPEYNSFQPANTSQMVQEYSGDFSYNIPLLSVGSFPLNLFYHSGVGMEEEATMVGLGWNIGIGSLNRQLMGVPDDFKGDEIKRTVHTRPTNTLGIDLTSHKGVNNKVYEKFGLPSEGKNFFNSPLTGQIYFNSNTGVGYRLQYSINTMTKTDTRIDGGLSLSYDSQGGFEAQPLFRFSTAKQTSKHSWGLNFGMSYSGRNGFESYHIGGSFNKSFPQKTPLGNGGSFSNSTSISFSNNYGVTQASVPTNTYTFSFDVKVGESNSFGTLSGR